MIAVALDAAFALVSAALLLTLFRLVRGPSRADRVLALDTLAVNAVALIMLFGIRERTGTYFEAALLIAMTGFVATVVFAKFLLRGDVIE
jgi:multicomponent K+:H+ antiporter subunit F